MVLILLLSACDTAVGIHDRVLNADNVVHDYEWFHTAHERIGARVSQIAATTSSVAEETDPGEKSRLRVDLAGQQQSCRELSADYNANADKITTGAFRGWSLPAHVNIGDCE